VSDARADLVAAGYDAMIDAYEAWAARITDDPRAEWCDEVLTRLPRGARVVELACGGGTSEIRRLSERFALTFSGFEPETNRRLLTGAGLVVLRDEVVTIGEPEGEATFHWVLATR
jgi:hypothetical protein